MTVPTPMTGDKTPFAFEMDFLLGEIEPEKSMAVNVIWSMASESKSYASLLVIVDEEQSVVPIIHVPSIGKTSPVSLLFSFSCVPFFRPTGCCLAVEKMGSMAATAALPELVFICSNPMLEFALKLPTPSRFCCT